MPEKEDLKAPWLVGSLAWFITNSHSVLMTVVHWQSSWALSLKKIKDYSLVGLRLQVLSLFFFFTHQLNFPFAAFRGLPICMKPLVTTSFVCGISYNQS